MDDRTADDTFYLEEEWKVEPSFVEQGFNIHWVTPFGSCDFRLETQVKSFVHCRSRYFRFTYKTNIWGLYFLCELNKPEGLFLFSEFVSNIPLTLPLLHPQVRLKQTHTLNTGERENRVDKCWLITKYKIVQHVLKLKTLALYGIALIEPILLSKLKDV